MFKNGKFHRDTAPLMDLLNLSLSDFLSVLVVSLLAIKRGQRGAYGMSGDQRGREEQDKRLDGGQWLGMNLKTNGWVGVFSDC